MSTDGGLAAANRAKDAAERAARASRRVADLGSRLESLARGEKTSRLNVAAARAAFDESLALAAAARRSAGAAFTRAAEAHRGAAVAAQLRGDLARARQHWDLAAADDRSAAALQEADD